MCCLTWLSHSQILQIIPGLVRHRSFVPPSPRRFYLGLRSPIARSMKASSACLILRNDFAIPTHSETDSIDPLCLYHRFIIPTGYYPAGNRPSLSSARQLPKSQRTPSVNPAFLRLEHHPRALSLPKSPNSMLQVYPITSAPTISSFRISST